MTTTPPPMSFRVRLDDRIIEESHEDPCDIICHPSLSTTLVMADQYPQASLLVEPAELAKPEVAKQFVILDARERIKYEGAGINLDQPTATHCQGGGRASVMAFGLELMGAKDVSNYYKSWGEWGNADDTPVVRGKPKK